MIKVFIENENHKIELTKEELQTLLDEAYNDGYSKGYNNYSYVGPKDPFIYDSILKCNKFNNFKKLETKLTEEIK